MSSLLARTTCRACGQSLQDLLSLGRLVPSGFVLPDEPDPPAVPLDLAMCWACGLPQLRHTVPADRLYREYWYRSGINEAMREELKDVVRHVRARVELASTSLVIDVGANDGTLLKAYCPPFDGLPGCPTRIAFEPALNLFDQVRDHAEVVVPDFFPPHHGTLQAPARAVSAITSIAMFYDLEDPRAFVKEVDRILRPDGVWVLQMQDLQQMIDQVAFDNIVAEHLCYYSLRSLIRLLRRCEVDLHITEVERRAINGGSLRITVRRRTYPVWSSVVDWTDAVEGRLERPETLERFAWQVGRHRDQLQSVIGAEIDRFGPIALYAASTKSSTLLQYCGLDHRQIVHAAERTPEKWGRVTTGTRIPIVSEEAWRQGDLPATLIGAWQFAGGFLQREADYLGRGGRMILPLPQVKVVQHAR